VFQFLFKFPRALFAQGQFVFQSPLPGWTLWLLILAAMAGIAALIWRQVPKPASRLSLQRASVIWALQSLLVAVLLLMLWQPALTVTELQPQQNVVAVLVDDSRSMGILENGTSREAQAVKALQGGVLAAVARRFQTRLYRFDSRLTRIADLQGLQPVGAATHIGASLRQLAEETADLPVGAVVLLSMPIRSRPCATATFRYIRSASEPNCRRPTSKSTRRRWRRARWPTPDSPPSCASTSAASRGASRGCWCARASTCSARAM
jgi:hypothetical protein